MVGREDWENKWEHVSRFQKLPEVLFSVVVQGKQNLNGFFKKTRKGTHLHLSAGPPGIIKHSCVANS